MYEYKQQQVQGESPASVFARPQPSVQRKSFASGRGSVRPIIPITSTQTTRKFPLQMKLRINEPGDSYEQEADHVADQVMRMPDASPGGASPGGMIAVPAAAGEVQRKCAECEEEEKGSMMQRKESRGASGADAPSIVNNVIGSGGRPLDASVRGYMEPRFGRDFSGVRVHAGAHAAESARAVNARAYTVRNNVVFGANEYRPGSDEGKRLIAHELTHVVQQGSARAAGGPGLQRASVPRISRRSDAVLSRLPSPRDCTYRVLGLSYMPPIIKEGYDGSTYTAIKSGWCSNSAQRRWQIYDADDKLQYESTYVFPSPTLKIPKNVVRKGAAGGSTRPWSAWIKVIRTLNPFGTGDRANFPYDYMTFHVYNTWNDYMADPGGRLSTLPVKKNTSKPQPLDSKAVKGARSVVDYGSSVAMHESYLRAIYETSAQQITATAKEMVTKGAPQGDVAKWAVDARNQLKAAIRNQGNPILKRVFEARNLKAYGDKLGPSYQQLFQKNLAKGMTPEQANAKIIGSSGKSNLQVNRWAGRIKIAGRLFLALDIALAGVRVYLAPEGQKTKVALEEVARIGGALVLGAAGAKGGAAVGGAIGAFFGGAGAVPGAIIGGIIGGIGGAILGGMAGEAVVDKLYSMFPPSDCQFQGEYTTEDQKR
jgi:hypothetical protein